MKTPKQIIDELPEGKRKVAYQSVAELGFVSARTLWDAAESGDHHAAADMLSSSISAIPHTLQILADMIWEG